jgi:UDP-N-acetylmuramoyl-tripeptide--D-alanyl-D-alanine ligase
MSGASKVSFRPVPAATRKAIIEEAQGTTAKPLWRAQAVAGSVGGRACGDFAASDVAIVADDVENGALYFARAEIDANAALAKGAAGVVTTTPVKGPHVLVDETGQALSRLARAARNRARATVLAVLGFEKDTVPRSLGKALKLASRGTAWSTGTEDGLDLAMARLAADRSHAMFGIDGIEAPEPLRPHLVVVGPDATREAGRRAAAALETGGAAVLPADHPDFPRWRAAALDAGAHVLGYGRKASADIHLLDCVPGPFGGVLVTADLSGQRLCYTIADTADAAASLAVLGAMRAAGASLGAAAMVLADEAFNPTSKDG